MMLDRYPLINKIFTKISENSTIFFVMFLFVLLQITFSIYAGGPLGTDELLYADAGLQGYGNYIVMNRYTHIYLQLLFMHLASTPLIGMRIFWGFIMSTSAICVFLFGRYIIKSNNFLHGFVALAIFFSLNMFRDFFGIVLVDLTTMMMIMTYALLTLYYIRKNPTRWISFLLGTIFFLSFKSKEFAIVLLVTLPIIGFNKYEKFSFKRFFNQFLFYLFGISAGVVLLIITNWIIINDPFFGIRFSDWRTFRVTVESWTAINPNPESYLQGIIFPIYYFSFTLYICSIIKHKIKILPKEIFLWIMPVVYLLMLAFTMIRSGWRTDERYLFPIIALLSAFAPQYFEFNLPYSKKQRIRFLFLGLLSIISLFLVRQILFWFSSLIQMSYSDLLFNHALNMFFIILLIVMFSVPQKNYLTGILFLFFLVINLYVPITTNLKLMVRRNIQNIVNDRFEPLKEFEGEIKVCESSKLLISPRVLFAMRIKDDINEAAGMVNIYYDKEIPNTAFDFFDASDTIFENIYNSEADYIFTSENEWDQLSKSEKNVVLESYFLNEGSDENYLLLENEDKNQCSESTRQ